MTIRVLLADDEPLIRAGVAAILATDPEIDVVAEAGDGRAAIDLALRHRPDLALLDIRMPGLDGLGAAAELRTAVPATKVALLTTFDEDEYVDAALAHGIDGFLLKAADPRELLLGVRAVAGGAAFLSPRIAQKVIARFGAAAPAGAAARRRLEVLTDREREVLGLLGRGLSNAEIGRALFLAEATVKFHVSAILRRLDLDNRVQAAIVAYEAGLTRADAPAPD
ncbi:response regulator transcription factor [Nocardia sp. NPDC050717]|uniref:response regulator transcription factor n=1 Tax=Nocardia sp. NPDC050717 TaxID=3157221 RepID=UPI0033DF6F1E